MDNKSNQMIKQLTYLLCLLNVLLVVSSTACSQPVSKELEVEEAIVQKDEVVLLANSQFKVYLSLIENKNVALVGNHSSMVGSVHLVDTLISLGVQIKKVFSPEHGFRGTADAGEKVKSQLDEKTGLPIISLYGKNKKPTNEQLKGIDVLLFDIQDVGARFYTYISTLHYVMEAAAENGVTVIVLDRPNPNGNYVDGPVLQKEFKSFVGMHPVPVVHGMTIGEYAQMINGEKWLEKGVQCDLKVITSKHYSHKKWYFLKQAPSPNLPNMRSIYWYPSLCFFEGTPISVGRGTNRPFQIIGHPSFDFEYGFTPMSLLGATKPKLEGKRCNGVYLAGINEDSLFRKAKLDLSYLISFYQLYADKKSFFTNFFNLLAGNSRLQKAIKEGKTEEEIKANWEEELTDFKQIRKKYLLYEDFE